MSRDNNGVRLELALSMLISISKGFIKITQHELVPEVVCGAS
jgi:hypothetical protein